MRQREYLDEIARSARNGDLLLFCGAGVSMLAPSKSPSWWEIYAAAAHALAERFHEGFPEIRNELRLDEMLSSLQTQQLADLIVTRFAGATFVETLKVVDIADANENHMLIVALAAMGCLRGVLTTNFDTLLERTASIRGISWAVTAPGMRARNTQERIPLIKLHGSSVDALHLIETSSHKARELAPELAEAWSSAIRGADLLVLGYSGADLNFGAASAFFHDFVASGRHIWWLHRAGSRPELPDWIRDKVLYIEGALPNLLQSIGHVVEVRPFETPLSGRDAQFALRRRMEEWSKEGHIGRWGAATFIYALGQHDRKDFQDSPLSQAIEQLALQTAARFTPGSEMSVEDFGVAVFLDEVGRQAITRCAFQEAVTLLRIAVNLYSNFDERLEGSGASFQERQMNLSTAWGNFAKALLIVEGKDASLPAFTRSLKHAYIGGHLENFLVGLYNVLHIVFEYSAIRRCMQFVEGGIRIADRVGAIPSSIELRMLLAGYHMERNEIWVAMRLLSEAKRRAVAVHDPGLPMIYLMEGHILLKQGRVSEGLASIAETASLLPRTGFLNRQVVELGRHLNLLGARQEKAFSIDLDPGQVPNLLAGIRSEIAAAKAKGQLPWGGQHCAVSESTSINKGYAAVLFELGVSEFGGNNDEAIRAGLDLAAVMLRGGYFHDARWAVANVLARPAVPPEQLGLAHSFFAQANAELGYLDEVDEHLREVTWLFVQSHQPVPRDTLETGMWHSIQSGDSEAAAQWAVKVAESLIEDRESESRFYDVISQIESWGASMSAASTIFRRAAESVGFSFQEPAALVADARPFRRFEGVTAELFQSQEDQIDAVLRKAQTALSTGDADGALGLLDELFLLGSLLPEHQLGLALALQIRARAERTALADLDLEMRGMREQLVEQMAFSALARIETALIWAAMSHKNNSSTLDALASHSFIGEFCADPQARISLLACDNLRGFFSGSPENNRQERIARRAAHYFGTAEEFLLSATLAPDLACEPVHGPKRTPDPNKIGEEFGQALAECNDVAAADALLIQTVQSLRRQRVLSPLVFAFLRDGRAFWSLQAERFGEAARLYRKAANTFRFAKSEDGALNASAGEARSLSREGQFPSAVQVFQRALAEAKDSPIRPQLLLGLASALLREGTEHHGKVDLALIEKAKVSFRETIEVASLDISIRAHARLGLARALGQNGEQNAALAELDEATAEFAHFGSPNAKVLLQNRKTFEEGEWSAISLN